MSEEQLSGSLTDVDWASQAMEAGEGSAEFDTARKLVALGAMLEDKTVPPETAAGEADGALFGQAQAYQVGQGTLSAEDAADKVADRKASWFVSVATPWVVRQIETGCEVAGAWLGGQLGNPVLGAQIGRAFGQFMGKVAKPIVQKGLGALEACGKRLWGWAKENAKTLFAKAKDRLFL